jgi:Ca2+-binding RTX toxin-like protein
MGIYIALEESSHYLPSWMNTAPLETLADLTWKEKNGKDYIFAQDGYTLGNNKLSWTSGQSTASFSSKVAYSSLLDEYYLTSITFILSGADNTKLTFTASENISSSGGESSSLSYITGAATKTKVDDISYTREYSDSWTSTSAEHLISISYKDGLEKNIKIEDKYSSNSNGFTQTLSITYSDSSKLKMQAGFAVAGTYDQETYESNISSVSIGSGSLGYFGENQEYVDLSFKKFSIKNFSNEDQSIIDSLAYSFSIYAESATFPISDLTTLVKKYVYAADNAISITSTSGKNIKINAGSGDDQVIGGNGNESITGGRGKDTLTGGRGKDKFVFDTALSNSNIDTIKDFTKDTDKIILDDDVFKEFTNKTSISSSQLKVVSTTSNLSGDGYLTYVTANDTLYYDADGEGAGDIAFVKVELAGTAAPTFTDFQIIA